MPVVARRAWRWGLSVLVLGVGYVGSALVQHLLARSERVVALDNLFSTDEQTIAMLGRPPSYQLIRGSVADPAALQEAFGVARGASTVFLLAAQASASPEAASPEYTEETNLRGPRLVLEAMRRFGVGTMVFGSSTRVYGDSLPADADESTPYGRFSDLSHLSKIYVEKLLEMHAAPAGAASGSPHAGPGAGTISSSLAGEPVGPSSARHGLRCLAIRLGLVYGPAPVMKTDYRFMTAPNKFCLQAARGEELTVWGDNRVGLIHVDDAARALLAAADYPGFVGYVPANAATAVAPVAALARLVAEAGERRGLSVRVKGPQPLDPSATMALPSRLAAAGFEPTRDLRRGIAETLDYFLREARFVGEAR